MPLAAKLTTFSIKGTVIDPGVIWEGFISWVCMPNMKSISYGSKVMGKAKAFCHRQTDLNNDSAEQKKCQGQLQILLQNRLSEKL